MRTTRAVVGGALIGTVLALVLAGPARALEGGQKAPDFMLPAWDALVTDEKSPIYRYAKRAYFILDRNGMVKYVKVMNNPLDLLKPDEVIKAIKESGAS